MKVLHVIAGNDNTAYPFLRMLEYEQFDNIENFVLISVSKENVIKKSPLLLVSTSALYLSNGSFDDKELIKIMEDVELIFWHSFSGSNGLGLKWLLHEKRNKKKSLWIISDIELRQLEYYCDTQVYNKDFYKMAYQISRHIRVAVQNIFSQVSAQYVLEIKIPYIVPYPWRFNNLHQLLNFAPKTSKNDKPELMIQLGYSGLAINQHEKLFQVINEINQKYYYLVPLNFVDNPSEKQNSKWYFKHLSSKRKLYPEQKISFLSKQIDQEEYLNYLHQINAVFLFKYYANCYQLLLYSVFTNTPVFVIEDSLLFLKLRQIKFPLYSIQDIYNINDIIQKHKMVSEQIKALLAKELEYKNIVNIWKNLFKEIY